MPTLEAPGLIVLRDQLDKRWPRRSRIADRILGPGLHAAGNSIDVTYDPVGGPNLDELAAALCRDARAVVVIWNKRVVEASNRGASQPFLGGPEGLHEAHLHLEIDPRQRADQTPWALGRGNQETGEPSVSLRPDGLRVGDFVVRPTVAASTDDTHDSHQNEHRNRALEQDQRDAQRSISGGAAPAWNTGPRATPPRLSPNRPASDATIQLRDPVTGKPLGRLVVLETGAPAADGRSVGIVDQIGNEFEKARTAQREALKNTWLRDTWVGRFLNLDDKPAVQRIDRTFGAKQAPLDPNQLQMGEQAPRSPAIPRGPLDPAMLRMGELPGTPIPRGPLDPGLLRIGSPEKPVETGRIDDGDSFLPPRCESLTE